MTVRCRACQNCLAARAFQWMRRATLEIEAAPRTWFGTMTLSVPAHERAANLARVRLIKSGGDWDELSENEQFLERHREISVWITNYFKKVRKAANAPLRLLVVAERHKSGLPHYHALVHELRAGATSERALRGQWVWGFSKFKLVEKTIGGKAAWYVAKYLGKSMLARVRASIDYGELERLGSVDALPEFANNALSIGDEVGVRQDTKPDTPQDQVGVGQNEQS